MRRQTSVLNAYPGIEWRGSVNVYDVFVCVCVCERERERERE